METVFCDNTSIDKTLHKLYSSVTTDPRIQIVIDSYIPCCIIPCTRGIKAELYQMLYDDTPQFGNLPDLGDFLRASLCTMLHKHSDSTPVSTLLHRTVQQFLQVFFVSNPSCRRHVEVSTNTDQRSVSVLLTLLLSTLMGLYPCCTRPTPWKARMRIFARVHMLMTADSAEQVQFVKKYPNLLLLAMGEYICRVVPQFLPVEFEFLQKWLVGPTSMHSIAARVDSFRQDFIDDGDESWEAWAEGALSVMHSVSKGKRQTLAKKVSGPGHNVVDTSGVQLSDGMDLPCMVLYPIHFTRHMQIQLDYQKLTQDPIWMVHQHMKVSILPLLVAQLQKRNLSHLAQVCERMALIKRKKIICLQCIAAKRQCEIRMCHMSCDDPMDILQGLTCSIHGSGGLIAVDMLGKVLLIGDVQYILAPCCNSIQVYTGNAHELWQSPEYLGLLGLWAYRKNGGYGFCESPELNNQQCCHRPLMATQRPKKKCFICNSTTGIVDIQGILDKETLRITTVHVCQRHNPSDSLIVHVSDVRQLSLVCQEWDKQRKQKRFRKRYLG